MHSTDILTGGNLNAKTQGKATMHVTVSPLLGRGLNISLTEYLEIRDSSDSFSRLTATSLCSLA